VGRNRWTFSLRGLCLFVFLAAAVFAWIDSQRRAFWREHRTATELSDDHDVSLLLLDDDYYSLSDDSSVPRWAVGEIRHGRLYAPITSALVSDTPHPEEAKLDKRAWGLLQSLGSLTSLWIQKSLIPQEFTFAHFPELKWVVVYNSVLTEEQTASIGGLSKLDSLKLAGVGMTDDRLESIVHLTGLTTLDLVDDKITDAGIQRLKALRQLDRLSIGSTGVTGATLSQLTCQETLIHLDLSETQVDDSQIANVVRFTKLWQLALSGTKVTAARVREIAQLESLEILDLRQQRVNILPGKRADREAPFW
jgi:hypothetical protein